MHQLSSFTELCCHCGCLIKKPCCCWSPRVCYHTLTTDWLPTPLRTRHSRKKEFCIFSSTCGHSFPVCVCYWNRCDHTLVIPYQFVKQDGEKVRLVHMYSCSCPPAGKQRWCNRCKTGHRHRQRESRTHTNMHTQTKRLRHTHTCTHRDTQTPTLHPCIHTQTWAHRQRESHTHRHPHCTHAHTHKHAHTDTDKEIDTHTNTHTHARTRAGTHRAD